MVGSIGTQNHTTFSNPHYPSPRLAASFLNNVNTGTATTQSPMGAKSIASGVAPGLMNYPATTTTLKRRSIDYLGSSPNSYPKKPKLSGGESHSIKGDAPIFMERLSSMSGFRMPKSWGLNGAGGLATGAEEGSSSKKKTPDKTALRLLPKHGIFPMPALHEAKKCTRFSLDKFNKLWDETDADIRAEVFARRLERTNMSLPPSNYWSSPTSGSGSRRHPHF